MIVANRQQLLPTAKAAFAGGNGKISRPLLWSSFVRPVPNISRSFYTQHVSEALRFIKAYRDGLFLFDACWVLKKEAASSPEERCFAFRVADLCLDRQLSFRQLNNIGVICGVDHEDLKSINIISKSKEEP
ncbi:hypothetical protein YC2023_111437 [Brassica napus]